MRMHLFGSILFLILLVPRTQGFAQDKTIDSLQHVLRTAGEDTNRTNALNYLSARYNHQADYKSAMKYASEALLLCEKLLSNSSYMENDKRRIALRRGMASALVNLASIYKEEGKYPEALQNYFNALKIVQELKNKSRIAVYNGSIGLLYWNQGSYDKALDYMGKSLRLNEELGDKRGVALQLGNMANVYSDQAKGERLRARSDSLYALAFEYYNRALRIDEEDDYGAGIALKLGNMGSVYNDQASAPWCSEKERNALYEKAIGNFFKALKLSQEADDKSSVAIWLGDIGSVYVKTGKFSESEKYLHQSLALSESISDIEGVKEINQNLGELYDTLAKITAEPAKAKEYYRLSLMHYKKFISTRDSIVNIEKIKKQTQAEMNDELQRQEEMLKEKHEKEQAIAEEKNQKQQIIIWFALGGLLIVAVFSVLLFNRFRLTRKQNSIIELQKRTVEEKNKDITDSINYAKKIQEAIFSEKEVKYQIFPDAFVLLLPRDIVSGDFYWFAEKNGRRLIAAVDCTGHGVPGAFMSMIGNYFLQEVVSERGIVQPDLVLSELRHLVINSLKQRGGEGETKDGMDMALLSFDDRSSTVEYAGANNPLWLVRQNDGKPELTEYEPNKRPIGYYQGRSLPFNNHRIGLQKGDALYIFTDGYADQFGGPQGKKLKDRGFKDVLLSISHLPMLEQEKMLLSKFHEWKGTLEQVDDVCVIGIRV